MIEDIAAAIGEMKRQWGAQQVVLIGHSGGSVLTADIAALHAGLVQRVVLVSCPCDVSAFRHYMAKIAVEPAVAASGQCGVAHGNHLANESINIRPRNIRGSGFDRIAAVLEGVYHGGKASWVGCIDDLDRDAGRP